MDELYGTNNACLDVYKDLIYKKKNNFIIFEMKYLQHVQNFLKSNEIEYKNELTNILIPLEGNYLINKNKKITKFTADTLYHAHARAFDSQNWYFELPKNVTFKSWFVELFPEEIDLIKEMNKTEYMNSQTYNILIQRIKKKMEKAKLNEYFVKLNALSPKDLLSGDSYPDTKKILVSNPIEVINLLFKSGRTRETLFEMKKDNIPAFIMLREFMPIPQNMEFRCFVCNNKMRAISQYHIDIFEQKLQNKIYVNEIRDRIDQFYKKIKDYIIYDDCIMDLVIWDDNKKNSWKELGIFIIEFNSFGAGLLSGSALYNWNLDYNILYKNKGKSDIRVLEVEPFAQKLGRLIDNNEI